MPARIAATLLAIMLLAAPAFSRESMRFSIFLNPYKYFLGLFNIGIELQCSSSMSLCVSAEYAGVRSGYLNKIGHPDLVVTAGFRYYASPGDPDVSGLYAGASSSCLYSKRNEGRDRAMDFAIGAEAGYRLFIDDSFYLVPRGLVNRTMRRDRFLFGAEMLMGAIP